MNRRIYLSLILTLFVFSINAQNFFVSVGGAQSFGVRPTIAVYSEDHYNITLDTVTHYQSVVSNKLNLGQGFLPALSFGYKVNKNIVAGLELSYLFGKESTVKLKDTYDYVYGYHSYVNYSISYRASSFILSPHIMVITNREDKNLNFYGKMGLSIGLTAIHEYHDNLAYDAFAGSSDAYTQLQVSSNYHRNLSFGSCIGTGIIYEFWNNINLYAEISLYNHSYSPKYYSISEFLIDDEDQLADMNTNEKEFELVEYVDGSIDEIDKPGKMVLKLYNIDMLQLKFGLLIPF